MLRRIRASTSWIAALLILTAMGGCRAAAPPDAASTHVPAPRLDRIDTRPGLRTAVFAGGCFWGMQWVFEHVRGVRHVTAGYAGGSAATAHYEMVSAGGTGHAESVRIRFDPSKVSFGQLLRVYFAVATDPTQLNRQGPDTGSQYRGVIFTTSQSQQDVARAYMAQLGHAHVYPSPIVTQVVGLPAFYPAEAYHQDYARLHPHALYILINDAPKLDALRQQFPAMYRDTPVTYTPRN